MKVGGSNMRGIPMRARACALLAAVAMAAAGCTGPPIYERTVEPAHADQESLLLCPHCGGQGLVECEACSGKGGTLCDVCMGFSVMRCPDCDLIIWTSDPTPETDLYYRQKTLGGESERMEAFAAELFDDKHLLAVDCKRETYMSALLMHDKRCPTCNSRGYVNCPNCAHGMKQCEACGGSMYAACPICRMTGFVPSLTGETLKQRGQIIRKRKR